MIARAFIYIEYLVKIETNVANGIEPCNKIKE